MYTKMYESMYRGSLATEGPWQALVLFQQLLVLADRHGDVDMTLEAVARITTVPLSVLSAGLPALLAPDKSSRSPTEDGRRIIPLDPDRGWGWHIVNYEAYRDIRNEDSRREYMRNYMRKRRTLTPVNNVNSRKRSLSDTEAYTEAFSEADSEKDKNIAPAAPDAGKIGSARKPDPLWESLLEACGIPKTASIPKSARGAYNRACKDLREIGADAEQVAARANGFRTRWPNVTLTPTALVRRWNETLAQPRTLGA